MVSQEPKEFLEILSRAVAEVISIQCSIEAKPNDLYLKSSDLEIDCALSAVIELKGAEYCGYISVYFDEKTYLRLLEGMTGNSYAALTDDLVDGAGELLNIIFGTCKRYFVEKNIRFQMSIPSVFLGNQVIDNPSYGLESWIIPFQSTAGMFHLGIVFR